MIFAIDYHGTWNRDPKAFIELVDVLAENGHEVYVVSAIPERQKKIVETAVLQSPHINPSDVFCSGWMTKEQLMERNNVDVDVWIDDNPESVTLLPESKPIQ